ncbi:hypothetical protein DLAC_07409 [Tieghemostelium lacteum]|uniref:2'-phosphotransferase n=1 Tax=Tieghemostelium lacteum TaxID=361077 RepID=A0A151ZCG0_TIELA|nr:hypothetical protein DLAC_07409 [Tieghemostelium lacteum]|eukprot:KYQ91636.1 hypothetical protein DLAC_07409 [Tieghemostelium lacteum]
MSSKAQEVKLSKTLSWILRHGALAEKLPIQNDGFVKITDLLANRNFKGVTIEMIKHVVDTNDKKRYYMELVNGEMMIRANQGHTLKEVDNVELRKVNTVNDIPVIPPATHSMVIHGTYKKHLVSILEKGLNKMDRNMIHFAIGDNGGVTSGMRNGCDMVIIIDLQLALDDGIEFFLSANDVALTNGIDGILPKKYFEKIIDRKGMTIWQR